MPGRKQKKTRSERKGEVKDEKVEDEEEEKEGKGRKESKEGKGRKAPARGRRKKTTRETPRDTEDSGAATIFDEGRKENTKKMLTKADQQTKLRVELTQLEMQS